MSLEITNRGVRYNFRRFPLMTVVCSFGFRCLRWTLVDSGESFEHGQNSHRSLQERSLRSNSFVLLVLSLFFYYFLTVPVPGALLYVRYSSLTRRLCFGTICYISFQLSAGHRPSNLLLPGRCTLSVFGEM